MTAPTESIKVTLFFEPSQSWTWMITDYNSGMEKGRKEQSGQQILLIGLKGKYPDTIGLASGSKFYLTK